jgi:pyruvate ferredoxin oxidoreductase beta subunit
MSPKGAVLKMAPLGKKGEKMPATELAKAAGCVYIVRMSPTNIKKAAKIIRRAIFVAREVGPTFIHAYTSCNIEYSIPTEDVFADAKEKEKTRFQFYEFMTDEAAAVIERVEAEEKAARQSRKSEKAEAVN